MAIDQQKLQIILEAKGVKLTKSELKSLQGQVDNTSGSFGLMAGTLGKVAGGIAAAVTAFQALNVSVKNAAQFEGVSRGFNNLAKATGLSENAFIKLKSATDGTVSSIDLMKQANNAMLLGIVENEDQMAEMFDIAQRLGQALGLDTLQAVESLTTGMGRQSKLMLDNLGIMIDTNKAYEVYASSVNKSVDSLTDQEKKTAFINATMESAKDKVEDLGEEQLTLGSSLNQLGSAFTDVSTEIGKFFAPMIKEVADEAVKLADAVTGVSKPTEEALIIKAAESAKTLFEQEQAMIAVKNAIKEQVGDVKGLNEANKKAKELGISQNSEYTILREVYRNLRQAIKDTKIEMKDNVLKQIEYIAQSGELSVKTTELRDSTQGYLDTLTKVPTQTGIVRRELSTMEIQLIKLKSLWDTQKKASEASANATAQAAIKQGAAYKNAGLAAQNAAEQVLIASAQKIVADYLSSIFASVPFPLNLALGAGASAAAGSLIQGGVNEMKKIKFAADGMDEIVTQPTPIVAGEAGAEQVTITPLGGVGDAPSGGGGVTVNLSGNVMTQDFVEGELSEAISEAIRRGNDFGIS